MRGILKKTRLYLEQKINTHWNVLFCKILPYGITVNDNVSSPLYAECMSEVCLSPD